MADVFRFVLGCVVGLAALAAVAWTFWFWGSVLRSFFRITTDEEQPNRERGNALLYLLFVAVCALIGLARGCNS